MTTENQKRRMNRKKEFTERNLEERFRQFSWVSCHIGNRVAWRICNEDFPRRAKPPGYRIVKAPGNTPYRMPRGTARQIWRALLRELCSLISWWWGALPDLGTIWCLICLSWITQLQRRFLRPSVQEQISPESSQGKAGTVLTLYIQQPFNN